MAFSGAITGDVNQTDENSAVFWYSNN